jgi:hypothetical protein
MNFNHIEAARVLIDHARQSNDPYLIEEARVLETYLDGDAEVDVPEEPEEESL